jgi:GTP-binding protein
MVKFVKTNLLNDVISEIQLIQPAPSFNGGHLKVKFIKQDEKAKIPTFILFVNNRKMAHFSYTRFIDKQLRVYFGFEGTPIKLILKDKK